MQLSPTSVKMGLKEELCDFKADEDDDGIKNEDDDYDVGDDRGSEEPCDLRLLTPTTCLRELYPHTGAGPSIPSSDYRGSSMASLLRGTPSLGEPAINIKLEQTLQSPFRSTPMPQSASSIPGLRNIRVSGSNSGSSGSGGAGSSSGSGANVTTPGGAYTCTRCGNSYARPHSLNRHLRFECGVEPKFECPVCHKKSKHKHNLVLHMRTHQQR